MKKNSLTKYALPLVIAIAAGLASVASAVNLGVGANNELGAGTSVTSSCQPTGSPAIKVGFDTPSLTGGSYTVSTASLSQIAAACNGKSIKIAVLDGSNTKLAEYSGTISGTSLSASLSAAAIVSSVATVSIVIY